MSIKYLIYVTFKLFSLQFTMGDEHTQNDIPNDSNMKREKKCNVIINELHTKKNHHKEVR